MHDRPAEIIEDSQHTDLAKVLFNRAWMLLDTARRSPAQDDEMVAAAHASFWHWLQVGDERNFERGHWLIARCCAAVDRGHEALHHAERCLASCQQHDHGPFDLAFAHEARARALLTLGRHDEAIDALNIATIKGAAIESDDDRNWLTDNLDTLHAEATA